MSPVFMVSVPIPDFSEILEVSLWACAPRCFVRGPGTDRPGYEQRHLRLLGGRDADKSRPVLSQRAEKREFQGDS